MDLPNRTTEPVALGGVVQILLLAVWAIVLALANYYVWEAVIVVSPAVTGLIAAVEVAITFLQRGRVYPAEKVEEQFLSADGTHPDAWEVKDYS